MTESNYIQVLTTAGSEEEAERIARELLEKRLAACVQIRGPMKSLYWWEGKLETANEWLCLAKTVSDKYSSVETAIKDLHSYDTPEILAVPVLEGNADYLRWIDSETSPQRSEK